MNAPQLLIQCADIENQNRSVLENRQERDFDELPATVQVGVHVGFEERIFTKYKLGGDNSNKTIMVRLSLRDVMSEALEAYNTNSHDLTLYRVND